MHVSLMRDLVKGNGCIKTLHEFFLSAGKEKPPVFTSSFHGVLHPSWSTKSPSSVGKCVGNWGVFITANEPTAEEQELLHAEHRPETDRGSELLHKKTNSRGS